MRISTKDILARKGKEPLVVLTAYTAPFARLLDAHTDVLLVGDSLGMVLYGMDSTLPVTLEMMIAHGRTVVGASTQSLVTVDMPFGSYQESTAQAYRNAARLLAETGAQAVKLEGGTEMADTVRFLTERAIPVIGHVGLMPQHVHTMGGYKTQGRNQTAKDKILKDAIAIEKAGAFAIVLEGITESLARDITRKLTIPTIGIGASPACDGQVLVIDDLLGITEKTPRFVKRYAELGRTIAKTVESYAKDVRARKFPGKEHCTDDKR